MKLKQRVVGGLVLCLVLMGVVMLKGSLSFPSHLTDTDDTVLKSPHRVKPRHMDPFVRNSVRLSNDANNDGANHMPNAYANNMPNVDAPESQMKNGLNELMGHLNVMRQELDASNYTSNDRSPEGQRVQSRQSPPSPDQQLQKLILGDKYIMNRADDIIRLAHVIEETRAGGDVSKNDKPKEFIPNADVEFDKRSQFETGLNDDSDIPPGHEYIRIRKAKERELMADQVEKYEREQKQIQRMEVYILPLVMHELEDIATKMTKTRRPSHRRRGATFKIASGSIKNLTGWEKFHNHITQFDMYDPKDPAIQQVLDDLARQPLVELYQHDGGTQLKIVYWLENDGRALFKPMRFTRDHETLPNHFYFSDYERHTAEIASFHLDKVLDFHRVPPTAGRAVNMTQDIKMLADSKLLKTFFISPAGNVCFHGQCDYYCDSGHAICGTPDMLEGSLAAYLPSSRYVSRKTWRHPWRRSYHKRKKAEWETDNTYCQRVRETPPYDTGRRLLDLMDMSVFDFLQGNLDRHHYETFKDFGNYTFTMHLDNGRAFGKPRYDDLSILAPVYQCCLIRYSTFMKLVSFEQGPHLSEVIDKSMSHDMLYPILIDKNLRALDRRVRIILKTIHRCVKKNGYQAVIQDDGF